MSRKSGFALVAVMCFASFATMAEPAYVNIEQRFSAEQMRETGLDKLAPEQLKRLNQLLGEEATQIAKSEKLQPAHRETQASYIGLDDKPIKSRLKGSITGWEVDTVFELENGQHWKVLKGNMKLRKPIEAPEIVVVPGIAGRWFLQVQEDLPKARVYRID